MTEMNPIKALDALEADFEAKVRDIRDDLEVEAGTLRARLHEVEAQIEDCSRRLETVKGKMTRAEAADLLIKHVPAGEWLSGAEMADRIAAKTGDTRLQSTHVSGVWQSKDGTLKRKKKPKGDEGRHRFLYQVQP